jgi:hypothetical protein
MIIYGVRSSPYETYQEYFTTETKAENFISDKIAKQREYNLKNGTDYHYEYNLYTEEIEVN